MDEEVLKNKMSDGKYFEVFSELREYINNNPADKGAVKLHEKLLNDYKKREQKNTFTSIDTKMGFQQFDEAIEIIEEKATINLDRCIGCGLCVTTCSAGALKLVKKPDDQLYQPPQKSTETYVRIAVERGKNLILKS